MRMSRPTEYKELAKAKISESRNVVISNCSKGGFTVAQQLEAKESERTTSVFLKGAFHIEDIQALYNLRDACNYAIEEYEKQIAEPEWDEDAE